MFNLSPTKDAPSTASDHKARRCRITSKCSTRSLTSSKATIHWAFLAARPVGPTHNQSATTRRRLFKHKMIPCKCHGWTRSQQVSMFPLGFLCLKPVISCTLTFAGKDPCSFWRMYPPQKDARGILPHSPSVVESCQEHNDDKSTQMITTATIISIKSQQ